MFESSLHEECEYQDEVGQGSNYSRDEEADCEDVGVGKFFCSWVTWN